MRFIALAVLAASLPAVALADDAVVVGNAGPVVWTLDQGSSIAINTQSPFSIGGTDGASSFAGGVDAEGALLFPAAGIRMAPSSVTFSGITFRIGLSPTEDATGTVNPTTGVVTVRATFRVAITGSIPFFPRNCAIPALTIVASTESAGGIAYDPTTGKATLVDDQLVVPEARNCGIYTGIINSQLKLTSPAGTNKLTLVVNANPPSAPPASLTETIESAQLGDEQSPTR